MTDTDLPLPPQPIHKPGRATSDRIAIADVRAGGDGVDRIRNGRARMAIIRERAREHFRRLDDAARPPAPRGYTWRGWWYPRWLVLGITWGAVAVLAVLLVVGIFRLFGGAP